jgi:hypothetical protein
MNDSDNFLKRWSRRKREADLQPKKTGAAEASATSARGEEPGPDTTTPQSTPSSIPEFDVGTLPPIESIGADTDISAFMQKGVPAALRHAALRRAWSADPAIRDFMGPTENYWDAAGPDGIPGFGDLDPNLDVKRMISELFGDTMPDKPEPETQASMSASDQSGHEEERVEQTSTESEDDLSHRTGHAAVQKDSPQPAPAQRVARRHGGAMPE